MPAAVERRVVEEEDVDLVDPLTQIAQLLLGAEPPSDVAELVAQAALAEEVRQGGDRELDRRELVVADLVAREQVADLERQPQAVLGRVAELAGDPEPDEPPEVDQGAQQRGPRPGEEALGRRAPAGVEVVLGPDAGLARQMAADDRRHHGRAVAEQRAEPASLVPEAGHEAPLPGVLPGEAVGEVEDQLHLSFLVGRSICGQRSHRRTSSSGLAGELRPVSEATAARHSLTIGSWVGACMPSLPPARPSAAQ